MKKSNILTELWHIMVSISAAVVLVCLGLILYDVVVSHLNNNKPAHGFAIFLSVVITYLFIQIMKYVDNH